MVCACVYLCAVRHWIFSAHPILVAMVTGGDGSREGAGVNPNLNVTDLLRRLNLTEEEEAVADFTDDEEEMESAPLEWALVGKVLSPTPIHVNTVRSAMRPAWGNPIGFKLLAIGERG